MVRFVMFLERFS